MLHGRFADWVIADLAADGAAVPVRRAAVFGPPDGAALAEVLAGQDPAGCPLVAEVAAGGSASCRCARRTRWHSVRTTAGRRCWCAPRSARCCACRSSPAVRWAAPGGPEVLGVLTLLRTRARRAFSMAEAQAADVLSRHVGLAMRRPGPPAP
ncbi:hypothetical protein LUX05_20280 [Streptomyces somaliensis]|nr:hypothetical protein [Streptomyces somaliensis]